MLIVVSVQYHHCPLRPTVSLLLALLYHQPSTTNVLSTMPLVFLPSDAPSHSYATFNLVSSPAPPIPHLTSVVMLNRHYVQIQKRKDRVTPHKAHRSPAPFEPRRCRSRRHQRADLKPSATHVYLAAVVVNTQLPHDGILVLVKSHLSTSSLGSYTAVVLSPHHEMGGYEKGRKTEGGRKEGRENIVSLEGTGSWQQIGVSMIVLYVYPPCALY